MVPTRQVTFMTLPPPFELSESDRFAGPYEGSLGGYRKGQM